MDVVREETLDAEKNHGERLKNGSQTEEPN